MNTLNMLDETTHYGLLKTLEENPGLSQRELAKQLGVSLGKINYCLNKLIEKGSLKINNFRNSENKLAYPMAEIVSAMERVVGKRAVYEVVERGSEYLIDTGAMSLVLDQAGVKFGSDYLVKTINNYYGERA